MITFEERTGPDDGAPGTDYPAIDIPRWYQDAKLGCFFHWGIYSVPGWAFHQPGFVPPIEQAYAYHQYAEWYANTVKIIDSPCYRYHVETYGVGTSYEDLADHWHTTQNAVADLVSLAANAGARYIVPTTKHHDGFCLWDTQTTNFSAAQRGPKLDLIAAFVSEARARNLRAGLYYSGAHDWHISDFGPLHSDVELFELRRNDAAFNSYCFDQVSELIERFAPDILWNDIEWPDSGKYHGDESLMALLEKYLDQVPHGVINDRWGSPRHGFLTREYYDVNRIQAHYWEATRGLGRSFGFNRTETDADVLSSQALIHLLADVVSKNGNLLINVGPRADGSVPELQATRMLELGKWLHTNGPAIYATRPWSRFNEPNTPADVRYTKSPDCLNVIMLAPSDGEFVVPAELSDAQLSWLTPDGEITTGARTVSGNDRVQIPNSLRSAPAAVARLRK